MYIQHSSVAYSYHHSSNGNANMQYCFFLDVLLTVHLSIFISVINQTDAQNFALQ